MAEPAAHAPGQPRNAILLVSFASGRQCQALCAALRGLNYGLETITGDEWLARQASASTNTVVLLDNPRDVDHCVVDAVSRRSPQLLALADCGPEAWDSQIVGRFQDVLTWPCSDFEVRFRIDRLFASANADTGFHRGSLVERLEALGIVGRSPAILDVMSELLEFAACDVPVLIKGETGTGKELAARALHESSPRARRPFVSLNCGAIPDNLIENELFGHERGAFTDAKDSQKGLVAQAHGGTLFLDEVDTLSPVAQVALLRFLETQEYRPLGGTGLKLSDARIIAATNADLDKHVNQGKFRRDLLFRLDVCGVSLPPLRERDGDIDLLARHFLSRYAAKYQRDRKSLHPGMLEWMREFRWTGNVRELDNLLHRAFLLSKTEQIFVPKPVPGQTASSSHRVRGVPWRNISYKEAKTDALDAFERSYLTWLMAEARGNLSFAARKTGQQRSSLRRLLRKHDIDKNDWK